ncbi:ring-cleaving dioxygenase [Bacillus sp. 03113]|uniref:ring-cleaving dioxygenase n=1 Tax=Bacillus sp. 03113 TaxID=2578211 RepID=UPI00114156E3|nr:ring-cleaving dioxygenase [Bacillus sp. 03113]
MEIKGFHHVSAITAKAQENFQFYTKILGLRLVKKSVNQDNTSVYHLFYGDEIGSPGTELTFFEIPMTAPNHEGVNSISSISLRVASNIALAFWQERFEEFHIEHEEIQERAGRLTLAFKDFEGQRLMLVSDEHNVGVKGGVPWNKSAIPQEFAILGLGPVKLTVRYSEPTVGVLTEIMGFKYKGQYPSFIIDQPDIAVYETGEGGSGTEIHIEERKDLPQERLGRGGAHHVAFRVENENELRAWIEKISDNKLPNSGFVDRYYFRSLYFREPNGILFEFATDGPGFATDEDINHLGEKLALPPFLEGKREQIEAKLKPLSLENNS